jgi:RNA polymerase sigma-70 factor (ECF subfamily)
VGEPGDLGDLAQHGRRRAVRALLAEYVPRVYRFALRLTRNPQMAEDLTQETMLQAWRHRRRLRDARAARVWLFQIAVNLWRDQARRQQRRPKQTAARLDQQQSPIGLPDREAIDREDLQRAIEAMDSLPPRQREVLYLHACEGLSLGEIAGVLEISPDAVKASLSLARKRIRRQLKDMCGDRFPTT